MSTWQCPRCNVMIYDEDICPNCGYTSNQYGVGVYNPENNTLQSTNSAIIYQYNQYKEKRLSIDGFEFTVSPRMDEANAYRLMFRNAANFYIYKATQDYVNYVHDIDTFFNYHLQIYERYQNCICQGILDVLICDGIYTETIDSIRALYDQISHGSVDIYNHMVDAVDELLNVNVQKASDFADYVPEFFGYGSGFLGAIKGIATAAALNAAGTAIVKAKFVRAYKLTPAQRRQVWALLERETKFVMDVMHNDFWNGYLVLEGIKSRYGWDIWLPNENDSEIARRIIQNINNPNFPRERVPEMMARIIMANPFDKRFQYALYQTIGLTDEVKEIYRYFGFDDFSNSRNVGH